MKYDLFWMAYRAVHGLAMRLERFAARVLMPRSLRPQTFNLDLTPEGYVKEWAKRGRQSTVPVPGWERQYQERGLIEEAQRAGLIQIGRDVACTVTLTARGEALLVAGPSHPQSGSVK
jgi:hypothetical protein